LGVAPDAETSKPPFVQRADHDDPSPDQPFGQRPAPGAGMVALGGEDPSVTAAKDGRPFRPADVEVRLRPRDSAGRPEVMLLLHCGLNPPPGQRRAKLIGGHRMALPQPGITLAVAHP